MPPIPPPQIATVQPSTVQVAPNLSPTPGHFKDLSTTQARWLEVLERNGILKTNPSSELFGPEQIVRREELLMSEARIVELILRQEREQQTKQQAVVERLNDEIAQLRQANRTLSASLESLHTRAVALSLPLRSASEPLNPGVTTLAATALDGEEDPSHRRPPQPTAPTIETVTVESRFLPTYADHPVEVRQTPAQISSGTPASIDLGALVRHRHKLRQFPRLQRFLQRAGQFGTDSTGYEAYVQVYLASSGLTRTMLQEATRQAAWFDAQGTSQET